MREPKVTTKVYYLLRFWRQRRSGKRAGQIDITYAREYPSYTSKREWTTVDEVEKAFQFETRKSALAVRRATVFQDLIKGPRNSYTTKRQPEFAWYWEVVKVTETVTSTFEEETERSNAPSMVQLARVL